MAFSYTVVYDYPAPPGSVKYKQKYARKVGGTWTNDGGSTGGDIHPGLTTVKTVQLTPGAAATTQPYYGITSAASGFTVTGDANEGGSWETFGFR